MLAPPSLPQKKFSKKNLIFVSFSINSAFKQHFYPYDETSGNFVFIKLSEFLVIG